MIYFLSFFRIELIQGILSNIGRANDAALQSEVKVLQLLEKQTRLQEESMSTEKEFLSVFKIMMNNMSGKQ